MDETTYGCGLCRQPVGEWAVTVKEVDGVVWTTQVCSCGQARFVRADKGELDIGVIT